MWKQELERHGNEAANAKIKKDFGVGKKLKSKWVKRMSEGKWKDMNKNRCREIADPEGKFPIAEKDTAKCRERDSCGIWLGRRKCSCK